MQTLLSALKRDSKKDPAAQFRTPTLKYVEISGATGVLIAIAVVVLTPFFWVAVGAFYLAMALFLFCILKEKLVIGSKTAFLLGTVTLVGLSLKYVVFFDPAIHLFAQSSLAYFKTGTSVYGIPWQPAYSELRVAIKNDSDRDYENLDVKILPNAMVDKFVQVSTLSSCESIDPTVEYSVFAHGTDPVTGKPFDEPAIRGPNNLGIRVKCTPLPKHSSVQMVFATMNSEMPSVEPKEKRPATAVRIVGDYSVTYRPYRLNQIVTAEQLEH